MTYRKYIKLKENEGVKDLPLRPIIIILLLLTNIYLQECCKIFTNIDKILFFHGSWTYKLTKTKNKK